MYYRWLDMHNYAIKLGTSVSRNNIGQENWGLIFGWAYTRGGLFTGLYGIWAILGFRNEVLAPRWANTISYLFKISANRS